MANTIARTDDQEFEALLEYTVTMTLKDEPLDSEQPNGKSFKPETHARLRKEYLRMMVRRGLRGDPHTNPEHNENDFIAVDIHGNFDLDCDNPGPVLNRESQWISQGYTSLKNVGNIPAIQKKEAQLSEAVFPGSKYVHGQDSEDPGYEFSSSEVSQHRCRVSPYYPACDSSCWLKAVRDLPRSEELSLPFADSLPASPDVYQHLNASETRVLILQPGPGMEPIVCQLEAMAIPGVAADDVQPKAPEKDFEALSFAWGSPARTRVITCHEQPFPVTTNLFHALCYLRYPDRMRTL